MTNPSEATPAQIAFLQLLDIYKRGNHQRPVSTANKDIDWDAVEAADAIGDIYTGLTVTPGPGGGRMVTLNGVVAIDGQSLQLISDDQRNALVYALENPDAADSAAILKALGTSPQLRLRYPQDADAGRTFVNDHIANLDGLDDQDALNTVFTDLVAAASDADMFRLYDLSNGHKGGTRGDPTRRERCVEFALRMGPTSLPELVSYFEFYDASCEAAALSAAHEEIDQRRRAGETIGAKTQKTIRKAQREKVSLQDSSSEGNLGDGVFEDIANTMDMYKTAVTTLGFGTGPIACPYVEGGFAANLAAIKARHATLKFGDLNSVAYHTLKHSRELPPAAQQTVPDGSDVENRVFSYYTAARGEVNASPTSVVQIGQTGGEKHVFKTNNMRAIAWLGGGQTGLATYTS